MAAVADVYRSPLSKNAVTFCRTRDGQYAQSLALVHAARIWISLGMGSFLASKVSPVETGPKLSASDRG